MMRASQLTPVNRLRLGCPANSLILRLWNSATMTDIYPSYNEYFRGRRVLVTGGAGFIGSHIVERLLELEAQVRVLDDLSTGHRTNLPNQGEKLIEGSILDRTALKEAVEGCDCVFHEGAFISVPLSVEEPYHCIEINIIGTERLLEVARDAGVKRLVFAASSSAYGDSEVLPSLESQEPNPCSPYAASKLAGELLLNTFSHCYGLSTVSLRYFNVCGPRQDPKSAYAAAISAFADALTNGRQPTIFGDGEQTRDFVYVRDVVHANLLAASCDKPLAGEVMNIGTGGRISLLDILKLMGQEMGIEVNPIFEPVRAGDVKHTCADISKAREIIAYEPLVSFEDGLKQTIQWMQAVSV